MTPPSQLFRRLAMNNGRFSIAVMISVIACFGSAFAPAADELISGSARVADGDTIEINAQRIRLEGIDAPETDQVCLDAKGAPWTCGIAARDGLSSHIAGRTVSCTPRGGDRYGRMLATCLVGGENLNAFMVREGLALDYAKYSREYISEEDIARAKQRGLWAGAFIAPWDWRHRDRKTVILGALSVPVTAQAQLLAPASSATAPSPECTIKGNVNRRGDRVYHMPGQVAYAMINMQDPQKRWFCSEDEARAAGWRPARK
jgi:endonuclease YncB( thermonuclease family)